MLTLPSPRCYNFFLCTVHSRGPGLELKPLVHCKKLSRLHNKRLLSSPFISSLCQQGFWCLAPRRCLLPGLRSFVRLTSQDAPVAQNLSLVLWRAAQCLLSSRGGWWSPHFRALASRVHDVTQRVQTCAEQWWGHIITKVLHLMLTRSWL